MIEDVFEWNVCRWVNGSITPVAKKIASGKTNEKGRAPCSSAFTLDSFIVVRDMMIKHLNHRTVAVATILLVSDTWTVTDERQDHVRRICFAQYCARNSAEIAGISRIYVSHSGIT